MAHRPTPEPDATDGALEWGCFLLVGLFTVGAVWVATATSHWYVGFLAIPGVIGGLNLFYGFALRLGTVLVWRSSGIKGVLIYSDSPNWKAYIEEQWLGKLGGKMIVLNWSQRKRWRFSLASEMHGYYCGWNQNYNPAAVIPRGLRQPLVFRFFYAFRDAKHGNREALERLEKRLFAELGTD